jgi:quinolinate synthase
MYQIQLPDKYTHITDGQAVSLISKRKDELSGRVVVLAHHYQRDEIVRLADYTGDSLKLSQIAAQQRDAEYIVFCGVHFMAESADILTGPEQKVLLPDMTAGCSMADMAGVDQVEQCWGYLIDQGGLPEDSIVPVTYVNSSAAIKAFCGRHEGLGCTSSNCQKIFEWVWGRNPDAVILFLPDQHLGRNTAYKMGYGLGQMCLWDPYQPGGGVDPEKPAVSQIILWDGFCSVHQEFTVEQIALARQQEPDVKVIVHPECRFEVACQADFVGSTDYIIKTIGQSKKPSSWVVGTEMNLVNRLGREMAPGGVKVRSLSDCPCKCETMYRIDLGHLAWLMDTLYEHVQAPDEAKLYNQVVVPEDIRQNARKALEKMLAVTGL